MTADSRTDDEGTDTGRRGFLKTVGAAGAATALTQPAAGAELERTIGDGLDPSSGRPQEAVVVFRDTDGVDRMADLAPASGYHALETLPLAYAELDGDEVREVAAFEETMRVVDNRTAELANDDSHENTNAETVWNDDAFGYRGEGITVAVIDTGLDGKHPGHDQNPTANYQWVGDPTTREMLWQDVGPANTDERGHGTHCAGSIAGDGDGSVGGEFQGMAPDASVVSYASPLSGLTRIVRAAAYDHIISGNRHGDHDIRVVSNSWTWGDEYDPWHPVPVAAWWAFQEGVLTVFAAGNAGPDPETLNETKDPFALSVGATDAEKVMAGFSSRGIPDGTHDRKTTLANIARLYREGLEVGEIEGSIELERPGVVAKGDSVISTNSPEQAYYYTGAAGSAGEPLYAQLSGTSMACPTTAGCVALFLAAYRDEHGEYPSPVDTINTLEATAREADNPTYNRVSAGAGHVDVAAAVEAALGADGRQADQEALPPEARIEALPESVAARDPGLPGFEDVDLATPYDERRR